MGEPSMGSNQKPVDHDTRPGCRASRPVVQLPTRCRPPRPTYFADYVAARQVSRRLRRWPLARRGYAVSVGVVACGCSFSYIKPRSWSADDRAAVVASAVVNRDRHDAVRDLRARMTSAVHVKAR